MTTLHALILGLVQGLSEFLPISSSAHLTLVPWLFGWPDPGLGFDVALHFGTLIAVVGYFWSEWMALAKSAGRIAATREVRTNEDRRLLFLVVATVPGAIAGLLFEKQAESAFRDPRLVAILLMVMGGALWLVDRMARQDRPLESIRWSDALAIGLAQMFAIIPGVSRSGSTITAGRALGLTREGAAIFSFLMSMPIIAAAALLKLPGVLRADGLTTPMIVGVAASAVSGWFAIGILLRFVVRRSYGLFALYRLLVGIGVLALVAARG